MKYLLIVLLLSGCSMFKPIPEFPAAPKELTQRCDPLKTIDNAETKISVVTTTVVKNYQASNNCAIVVDGWNNWYTEQKKIYESKK